MSENFTSAAASVSANTGASKGEQEAAGAVTGQAPFPDVVAAFQAGALPIEMVEGITRLCATPAAERSVRPEFVADAERLLAEQTVEQGLTVDQTRKAVTQVLALHRPP